VWGLGWSLLAIMVIIPALNPQHVYLYWQFGGVAGSQGTHFSLPGLLGQLGHSGQEKLLTTLAMLATVLFLAVRSPLVLVTVPNLFLRFASTHYTFWGTGYHYNAPLMPVVFIAGVDALARLSARPADGSGQTAPEGRSGLAPVLASARATAVRWAPAGMVAVAVAFVFSFPLSLLWQPSTFAVSPSARAQERAMAMVPDGVTVEATVTMLAPMAARDTTSWIATRFMPPQYTVGLPAPQYVLFDALRSNVPSCQRVRRAHAPCVDTTGVLKTLQQVHPGARYVQLFKRDHVYLFRRVSPPTGDRSGGSGTK
jgi:uncharacterized membrane protein